MGEVCKYIQMEVTSRQLCFKFCKVGTGEINLRVSGI